MSLNIVLGDYSELAMLLAGITYAVAFIFYTYDLANSSKTAERTVKASKVNSAAAQSEDVTSAGAAAGKLPEAHKNVVGGADLSIPYVEGNRMPAKIAVNLTILGFLIHLFGVVARGIAANRVPWGNMYEFCTTGALIATAIFLLTLIKRDLRFLGTFVTGLVVLMLCAAAIGFPTPVGHLVPALQSYWLVIHVSVAVMASAVFTITFCMSVLQLLQERREKAAAAGKDTMRFLANVPAAKTLENLSYRFNTIGFVMWTFTLMAGAIWAEHAWGRYWGWDVKESWTFIIWVVYAGYLHARATRGWTGARSAWLSIIGYLCIIFNFTVVNIYFSGLHSYSGLK